MPSKLLDRSRGRLPAEGKHPDSAVTATTNDTQTIRMDIQTRDSVLTTAQRRSTTDAENENVSSWK